VDGLWRALTSSRASNSKSVGTDSKSLHFRPQPWPTSQASSGTQFVTATSSSASSAGGGMATVYLARDLKHDRLVALKVLHPELAAALLEREGHEKAPRKKR